MTAPALMPRVNPGSASARRAALGDSPVSLADIYQDEVNIAVWQRQLSSTVADAAKQILDATPNLQVSVSMSPDSVHENLTASLGSDGPGLVLITDIAELAEMFACLFDLKRIGLRLTSLGHAMCPRFHVDNVPCRLVTTYAGSATEWLPHDRVQRSKLGPGSQGLPDAESGLYSSASDIQQLGVGDVALLKGSGWEGNEDGGLVHRSPQLAVGTKRLLLSLDFSMT